MSKAEGRKIIIDFTMPLIGIIATPSSLVEVQDGDWIASNTREPYSVGNAKDGNVGTYWRTNSTGQYIQITRPNTALCGFKIYKGTGFRPAGYTLQISNDGITYTDVKSGSFIDTSGWETIDLNTTVDAYYIRVVFTNSSFLYIYELVLLVASHDHQGSVGDFTITGQEYIYVDGPDNNGELIDKNYEVEKIERYLETSDKILLTIKETTSFNSVVNAMNIAYDQSKGYLGGVGGAVDSFNTSFTPTDLAPLLNPRVREYINMELTGIIALIEIEKIPTYKKEYISMGFSGTIELIHIEDLNP